jgi:hypothetical protein
MPAINQANEFAESRNQRENDSFDGFWFGFFPSLKRRGKFKSPHYRIFVTRLGVGCHYRVQAGKRTTVRRPDFVRYPALKRHCAPINSAPPQLHDNPRYQRIVYNPHLRRTSQQSDPRVWHASCIHNLQKGMPLMMLTRPMKTGTDVIQEGLYASNCCSTEVELRTDAMFPRCPNCMLLTVWFPVSETASEDENIAA